MNRNAAVWIETLTASLNSNFDSSDCRHAPPGNYRLNLRQSIYLVLKADSEPAMAVQRFVDALAETQFGPRPTDVQKVDIFEAWLKGGVKGTDAGATIVMQLMAERLHKAAPELMTTLHTLARADADPA